jgi:serine/threonine protein kinase
LFEMLTGTRTFPGDDATDTIVSVVSKEPDWNALPSPVSAGVRRLLRRCLEKEPKRGLDSAAAVRLEIDEALAAPSADASVAAGARSPRRLFCRTCHRRLHRRRSGRRRYSVVHRKTLAR